MLNEPKIFAALLIFTTITLTKHLYKKEAPPGMGQEDKKKNQTALLNIKFTL